MPSKRATIIYTSIVLLAGLCVEILLAGVLVLNRDGLIQQIVTLTRRPYLLTILQQNIITPQKFQLIRLACWGMLVIVPVIVFILFFYRKKIIAFIQFTVYCFTSSLKAIANTYKNNSRQANMAFWFLLLVITVKAVYYIIHFELMYDEMWSYNYFTSRPFYLTFLSYNNYPLYELSTQLFKWLPFSMKINLRLSCLLAGLSSCVVLYACVKNYTGHAFTALAGMALFACMPVTTFYMLYGRGVIFELFFAIVSIFCLLYLIKENSSKKYFILFVVANVAGMYSMPTHIYFLLLQAAIAFVYILLYKRPLLRPFILSNVLVVLISIICYLPVIAGSGISFVFNPAPVPGIVNDTTADLAFYNNNINIFFTGGAYGLFILLAATILAAVIFKRLNRAYIFLIAAAVIFCCLPTVIYLVQHYAVPERSLAFIGLVIPLCFCLIFYAFKDSFTTYALGTSLATLFIIGCIVSYQHYFINWSKDKDKKAITIANLLMQHHVTTCYDNADSSEFFYYYPALEFYYGQQHQSISINMAAVRSLRYKPYNANDNYDCIINYLLYTDSLQAKNYTVVYTDDDERFKILLRKK